MSMEESKSTVICAVPGCNAYLEDGIKMHKFPKGLWKQIWLIAINPSHIARKSKSIFACSSHFTETDYRPDKTNPNMKNLKATAVPTLNLNIVDENIVIDDTDSSSRDIVDDTQHIINLNTNNKPSTILRIDLPRMCRVCLRNDARTYNIYSKFKKEDELSKTIAEIIMIFTNIMIVETDKFPKDICEFCLSDLQRAYCFKNNCEKSNKLLVDYAKDFLNESCELSFIPKTFAAELLKEKIKQNILSYIKFQTTGTEIQYKENMLSETIVDLSEEIDNNKHEELEVKSDSDSDSDSDTDSDTCSIGSDNFIVNDSNDDSNDEYFIGSYRKLKCDTRNECHNYKSKLRPKSYKNHIDDDSNGDCSVDSYEKIKYNDETECRNYERKLRQTSCKNNQANVSDICDTANNNIIPERTTEESDYLIPSKRLCTNNNNIHENVMPHTLTISKEQDLNDKHILSSTTSPINDTPDCNSIPEQCTEEDDSLIPRKRLCPNVEVSSGQILNSLLCNGRTNTERVLCEEHNSTSTSSFSNNEVLNELQQSTTTALNVQETVFSTENTNCESASKSKEDEEIVNNATNNSSIDIDKSRKFTNIGINYFSTVSSDIPSESSIPIDIQELEDTLVVSNNGITQINPFTTVISQTKSLLPVSKPTNRGRVPLDYSFYFENQNEIAQNNTIATVISKPKKSLPVSYRNKRGRPRLGNSFYFENQNTIPQYNPIATVITENTLPQNKRKYTNRGMREGRKYNEKTDISIDLTQNTILSNQSQVSATSAGAMYNMPNSAAVARSNYNNFNIEFKQFAMPGGSTVENNTGIINNASQTPSQKHMTILNNYLQNDKMQKQALINWQIANAPKRLPSYNETILHQSLLSGTLDSEYVPLPDPVSLQTPNNTLIAREYNWNYYMTQNNSDRNFSNVEQINVPVLLPTLSNTNNTVSGVVNWQSFPVNEVQPTNYIHEIINQRNSQIMNVCSSSPSANTGISTENSAPIVNTDTSTTNSMFVNFTPNNTANNIVNNTVNNIVGFIKVKNLSDLL